MAESYSVEAVLKATGVDKFMKAFDDAYKKVTDFEKVGKGLQDVGKVFTDMGKGLTTAVTLPLAGAFTAATVGTQEFREEMAKLDTAFETGGHSVDDGRKSFEEFYKVMGETDTAVEAVNHLAMLTDNQEDLASWTDIATGVFATFGDSLPLEGLTEAANETAKVGQVTGPLADALNWAGVSEDAFNESLQATTSEQERQALITETLNDLYADTAEKYRENNEEVMSLREAQLKLQEAFARVGEILAPLIGKVADFVSGLVDAFMGLDEAQQQNIIKMLGLAAAIGPLLVAGGSVMTFIGKLLPLISQSGSLFGGLGLMFPKISAAVGALGKAFAILTGPVGIVIGAIGAFIGLMVYLYNTNETVRNAINTAWTAIKDAVMRAVEIVVMFVRAMVGNFVKWWNENQELIRQTAETVWNAIVDTIIAVIEFITPYLQVAWTAIKETVMVVWTAISGVISIAMNLIMGIIEAVMLAINGDWTGAWTIIQETLSNAWTYMQGLVFEVLYFIRDGIMTVLDKIASVFGVNMDDIKTKVENAFNFIMDVVDAVMPVIEEIIEGAWNHIIIVFETAVGVISGVIDFFSSMLEGDFEGMKNAVSDIWDSLWNGLKGVVDNAWSTMSGAFSSLWGEIEGWFDGLVDDALGWGKNMIDGFVDGIQEKIGAVGEAASEIASTVGGWLGFSSPAEKGEGRFIEIWGANMVSGFLDGVLSKRREVGRVLNAMIAEMKPDNLDTLNFSVMGISSLDGAVDHSHTLNMRASRTESILKRTNSLLEIIADGSQGINVTQNITSPEPMSEREMQRRSRLELQKLGVDFAY